MTITDLSRHKMRTARFTQFASGVLLLTLALASCREDELPPTHNRNLGTEQAPLLPTATPILNQRILEGPRVQATELPEFNEDIPAFASTDTAAGEDLVDDDFEDELAGEDVEPTEADDAEDYGEPEAEE